MSNNMEKENSGENKNNSKKNNAKQAFEELATMVGIDIKKPSSETAEHVSGQSFPSGSSKDPSEKVKACPPTIISESTMVVGNIQASGDVEVKGELKGNISSGGSVSISGKVLGDITAKKGIHLMSSTIQGNISTDGDVVLDKASVVMGNILAKNITLDGRVKGVLSVDDLATLQSNALLLGDVSAKRVAMNEGAQVVGSITVNQDAVASAVFEDIKL